MNRPKLFLAVATLLMVGAASGLLLHLRMHQRLGGPGLKTSPLPGTHILQVVLPEKVLDLKSEAMAEAEVVTNSLPRDTSYGQRVYTTPDGSQLLLNVVLMGTDRSSIHKPEICLTAQGWTIEKSELLDIPVAQPHPYALSVMKLTAGKKVQANGQSFLVRGVYVYWFVAEDRLTARHWQRMWWLAEELLRTGVLERWAYVSCFTVCQPGREDAAFEQMKGFIAAAVPQFQLTTGTPPAAGAGTGN
jgi:hypothetical protein